MVLAGVTQLVSGREAPDSSGQSDCKAQAASTTQAPPDQRAMDQAPACPLSSP